jgi:hypothetical protein
MAADEVKGASAPEGYDTKAYPKSVAAEASTFSLSSDERRRYKDGDAAFDTSEDPRYYKPIPTYEGIHRWDPDFEWTEEEEKRLIRKVPKSFSVYRTILKLAD